MNLRKYRWNVVIKETAKLIISENAELLYMPGIILQAMENLPHLQMIR